MPPKKWLNLCICVVFFVTFSSALGFPFHFFWDKDLTDNARLLPHVDGPPFEAMLWSFEDEESSDSVEKSPQKLIRSGLQIFCLIHAFERTIVISLPHNLTHSPACSIGSVLSLQLRC
jgi:hypothetical protein